jgi:PAS domain S-box-containing protein
MVLNHENELQFALWSLENNPDGVFGIDENGSIIYVNHAACNALGYFKEELEGMQVVDFDPLMGSEYFGLGGKMMTALIKKEIRHFKTAHKHRDGHLIPVLITMSIHRREKQAVIICFVRNVEEQEETEKRLRSEIQERQEAENKLLSLNKMLERMAKKDQLTDLWNRRYFFDCVTQEIERVKCYGRNLSLLLVDYRPLQAN